ncbi:hypothetical protein [Marinobacterium aestuariivivens]|uniref:Uncharacterized protein n=1 Tax=Marinobacterium aestuariivivens TaxID=1698799 RepID=A0ABW2A9L6_9GAMM
MKIRLEQDQIDLISTALLTHRWKVEKQIKELEVKPDKLNDLDYQNLDRYREEFRECATVMDKLAVKHDGAEVTFL